MPILTAFLGLTLTPGKWITHWMGDGAQGAVRLLVTGMTANTQVTIGTRYTQLIHLSAELAAFLGVLALLIAGARTALTGNVAGLGRDLVRVFLAIISGFAILAAMPLAEAAVHAMSAIVATTFASSANALSKTMVAVFTVTGITVVAGPGSILLAILAGLIIAAALALWLVLILAQAVVYVAAFFVPLAWVVSPKIGRRMLELLGAMLLVPFIVTSIVAVGFAIIADGPNLGTTLEHMVAGIGILFVAAFSPLSALKLLQSGAAHVASARHPHQQMVDTARTAHGAASGAGKAAGGGAKAGGGSTASAALRGAMASSGGPVTMAAAAAGAASRRRSEKAAEKVRERADKAAEQAAGTASGTTQGAASSASSAPKEPASGTKPTPPTTPPSPSSSAETPPPRTSGAPPPKGPASGTKPTAPPKGP